MAPILGIAASQITGHLWAPSNSYDSIATTTVGSGGASSITFSSIPSTYKHLQIRLLARSTDAAGTVNVTTQLNSDTGSNYAWHRIFGNGTTAGAGGASTQTNIIIGQISGSTAASGVFGVATIDLLDYKETTKYKTLRALFGFDDNNGGAGAVVQLFSGLWQSTSATTTITLNAGGGFAQYTSAALYGIKG
jgi:hypothetical protein